MRCVKCGESWDMDTLHDELSARLQAGRLQCKVIGTYPSGNVRYDQGEYGVLFDAIASEFRRKGCATITSYKAKCSPQKASPSDREMISAVYDIFGEDMDAAEAMLDDAEYLGW